MNFMIATCFKKFVNYSGSASTLSKWQQLEKNLEPNKFRVIQLDCSSFVIQYRLLESLHHHMIWYDDAYAPLALSSCGLSSDEPSLSMHIIWELWDSKCNSIDTTELERRSSGLQELHLWNPACMEDGNCSVPPYMYSRSLIVWIRGGGVGGGGVEVTTRGEGG